MNFCCKYCRSPRQYYCVMPLIAIEQVQRLTLWRLVLYYSFPVGDNVEIAFGPRINWYRLFDYNAFTFILTGANSFNSNGGTLVNAIDRGSGAIITWMLV